MTGSGRRSATTDVSDGWMTVWETLRVERCEETQAQMAPVQAEMDNRHRRWRRWILRVVASRIGYGAVAGASALPGALSKLTTFRRPRLHISRFEATLLRLAVQAVVVSIGELRRLREKALGFPDGRR
jgi:hypothetical protein